MHNNIHKNNNNNNNNNKVIIGLSGGVDSSVAAYLLKKQGYKVEALFMKNWEQDDTDSYCAAQEDLKDAQEVCDKLNITLHTVNFSQEYWNKVFTHFLEEYKNNRTPNPDILCNKEIKFKCFLEYALNNLQADYIATGHYAQIAYKNNNYYLLKALDHNKDQSYFLHALNQYQLSKAIFPLGELHKPDIRAIAKENGLITHDKKDSTGICFIGERNFKKFLSKYLPAMPGNIIDQDNNIIGRHDGLMYYTIGQRKGLNLGGLKNHPELPWYVAGKDLNNNTLLVVQQDNSINSNNSNKFNIFLDKTEVELENIHFINQEYYDNLLNNHNLKIKAKSRYRQTDFDSELIIKDNNNNKTNSLNILIKFDKPQRAITPGQSMVFYDFDNPEICLGGAIIK